MIYIWIGGAGRPRAACHSARQGYTASADTVPALSYPLLDDHDTATAGLTTPASERFLVPPNLPKGCGAASQGLLWRRCTAIDCDRACIAQNVACAANAPEPRNPGSPRQRRCAGSPTWASAPSSAPDHSQGSQLQAFIVDDEQATAAVHHDVVSTEVAVDQAAVESLWSVSACGTVQSRGNRCGQRPAATSSLKCAPMLSAYQLPAGTCRQVVRRAGPRYRGYGPAAPRRPRLFSGNGCRAQRRALDPLFERHQAAIDEHREKAALPAEGR